MKVSLPVVEVRGAVGRGTSGRSFKGGWGRGGDLRNVIFGADFDVFLDGNNVLITCWGRGEGVLQNVIFGQQPFFAADLDDIFFLYMVTIS